MTRIFEQMRNSTLNIFYISIKPITCSRYEVGMLDLNLFFIKAFCSCRIQLQMATCPNTQSPKKKNITRLSSQNLKGSSHKNLSPVLIYSPSRCYKPLLMYLLWWTLRKTFWGMFVPKLVRGTIDFHSRNKKNYEMEPPDQFDYKHSSKNIFGFIKEMYTGL